MTEPIAVQAQKAWRELATPITLADNLRKLGGYWKLLDNLIGHREGAGRGGSREGQIPINTTVLDTMRLIEGFANTYARDLTNDDVTWRRPTGGCDILLSALAARIGHFDTNIMGKEVNELTKKARTVAFPDGQANIPIGVPCFDPECPGEMRVPIDRDHPIPENGLTLWRPTATCSTDTTHQCDARLLANSQDSFTNPLANVDV